MIGMCAWVGQTIDSTNKSREQLSMDVMPFAISCAKSGFLYKYMAKVVNCALQD